MSIIAVNGSPRPRRNTYSLMKEVIAGAEQAGESVKLFQFGQMAVAPCNACGACVPTARCIVQDDMQQIYEAIDSASAPRGLILGTPIYFDHLSAQLKAYLDRLYSYTYTELGQKMFPKGFKAVLVATYDDSQPDRYDVVLDWLADRLAFYHEIETITKIVQPEASQTPLAKLPDLVTKARRAGAKLAGK